MGTRRPGATGVAASPLRLGGRHSGPEHDGTLETIEAIADGVDAASVLDALRWPVERDRFAFASIVGTRPVTRVETDRDSMERSLSRDRFGGITAAYDGIRA